MRAYALVLAFFILATTTVAAQPGPSIASGGPPLPATLNVMVERADGTPVDDAYVWLSEPGDASASDDDARTDAEGRATIITRPGSFQLGVATRAGAFYDHCGGAPSCLELTEGETRDVLVRLPRYFNVTGTVLLNASVLPWTIEVGSLSGNVRTDGQGGIVGTEGWFRLVLPEGVHEIGVSLPEGSRTSEYQPRACRGPWLACISIDVDRDLSDLQLALPHTYGVTLRVADPQEASATVRLESAEHVARFAFWQTLETELPAGDYDVWVEPSGASVGSRCAQCLRVQEGGASFDATTQPGATLTLFSDRSIDEPAHLVVVSDIGLHPAFRIAGSEDAGTLQARVPTGELRIVGRLGKGENASFVDELVTIAAGRTEAEHTLMGSEGRDITPEGLSHPHVDIDIMRIGAETVAMGSLPMAYPIHRMRATLEGEPLSTRSSGSRFVAIGPVAEVGDDWRFEVLSARAIFVLFPSAPIGADASTVPVDPIDARVPWPMTIGLLAFTLVAIRKRFR